MASTSVLSPHEFPGKRQITKDPHGEEKWNRTRFTGAEGSKTMHIAGGHLPKPPAKHPHHRKNSKRTHRAR